MNRSIAMVIMSCDSFSDLWDGHVKLLEEMWPDRNMKTYIVTDKKSEKKYKNVTIISCEESSVWSDRLRFALERIEEQLIFFSLDDYFPIKKVNNMLIDRDINIMKEYDISYLRLFLRPKCKASSKIVGHPNFYWIDTNEKYSVNLYCGIWKKELLLAVIDEQLNPWQFEVKLTKKVNALSAKCAMSNNGEYVILDVVRKGKLLHKSNRYFKKHPGIYNGNRSVNSIWYELKLSLMDWGFRILPRSLSNTIRKILIKMGVHFLSQEAGY